MPKATLTKRQKQLLKIIYSYIKNTGYPPTFGEMKDNLQVVSNQSVLDLLIKLEEKKVIRRSESQARSIVLLPLAYRMLDQPPLVPFLGTSHAGYSVQPFEIDGQWTPLSKELAQLSANVFLLKVSGDSMINAGIEDGDIVLVKSAKEFVSKDIVLADVDGETTIKRFISEDKPPYIYLKPENPKYRLIHFNEKITLKGKVTFVLRQNKLIKIA